MSLSSHEQHTLGILDKVEAGERVSQRSLAKDLGIALGLTNLLIHAVNALSAAAGHGDARAVPANLRALHQE